MMMKRDESKKILRIISSMTPAPHMTSDRGSRLLPMVAAAASVGVADGSEGRSRRSAGRLAVSPHAKELALRRSDECSR
jgi:hypothetical protein